MPKKHCFKKKLLTPYRSLTVTTTVFLFIFCFYILLPVKAIGADVVQDMAGRLVKLPPQINRIVALGPGALRLVVYLDAFDKVVAVEEAEKERFPLSARPYRIALDDKIMHLPVIGEGGVGKIPDAERLIIAKPDVIFVVGMDRSIVDNLQKKIKTPFFVLDHGVFGKQDQEITEALTRLGKVLRKEKRAKQIVKFIESCRIDLLKRTSGLPDTLKSRVYIGGIGYKGRQGITSTESGFLPFKLIKAKNVADAKKRSGHFFADRESLIVWDPEIIFIDTNGWEIIKEEYAKFPDFFHSLEAIRRAQVYSVLPYNFYNTNIEVALANAYFMGTTLYPERFTDISPEKKADEIFRFFVREPVYDRMKQDYFGYGRVIFENGAMSLNQIINRK